MKTFEEYHFKIPHNQLNKNNEYENFYYFMLDVIKKERENVDYENASIEIIFDNPIPIYANGKKILIYSIIDDTVYMYVKLTDSLYNEEQAIDIRKDCVARSPKAKLVYDKFDDMQEQIENGFYSAEDFS